jgi:hypothetical protein
MHDADIEAKIDKILDSQDKGIREFEHTLENLKVLLSPLNERQRKRYLDYLFTLLVRRIRQTPPADPSSIDRQRRSISVLFRIQYEFGLVDMTLCKIIGFLDVDDRNVVTNWKNCITQDINHAVYQYADTLEQGTLDALKDHLAMYSHGGPYERLMHASVAFVGQLKRAIDNAEFSRFERQLRASTPDSPTNEEVSGQAATTGLSPAVLGAMKEAGEYLRSEGPFNPKKAADLMRASVEETGRDIVARLEVLTSTRYAGSDKDFDRRTYFRKVGFINVAEEKFFGAIYGLLSGEGTHKLVAPRETILVMERTVRECLLLLVHRLSDFKPQKLGNP